MAESNGMVNKSNHIKSSRIKGKKGELFSSMNMEKPRNRHEEENKIMSMSSKAGNESGNSSGVKKCKEAQGRSSQSQRQRITNNMIKMFR
jgi:hypothetical protein